MPGLAAATNAKAARKSMSKATKVDAISSAGIARIHSRKPLFAAIILIARPNRAPTTIRRNCGGRAGSGIGSLRRGPVIEEDCIDRHSKYLRHPQSERQAGVIFVGLHRIDRLA
eukprot:Opistho-1_new@97625